MYLMLLAGVCKRNADDIRKLLFEFADVDCDFNGENGPGYLKDGAVAGGYESNAEYVWDEVKDKENAETVIKDFVNLWMGSDSYYKSYDIEVNDVPESDYISVAIAYTTGS